MKLLNIILLASALLSINICYNTVAALSFRTMATKRMQNINAAIKRSMNKAKRSPRKGDNAKRRRAALEKMTELAEYHVVREECKVVVNDEGRRILNCIELYPKPNDFGMLAPIHDAALWVKAHTHDAHADRIKSPIVQYKQHIDIKRN